MIENINLFLYFPNTISYSLQVPQCIEHPKAITTLRDKLGQLARSELDRMLDEVVVSGGVISQHVICGRSYKFTPSKLAQLVVQCNNPLRQMRTLFYIQFTLMYKKKILPCRKQKLLLPTNIDLHFLNQVSLHK